MKSLLILINKNYYVSLFVSGVIYHLLFVKGVETGFWDKLVVVVASGVTILLYIFLGVWGYKKNDKRVSSGLVSTFKTSITVTISLALIEFFVLLIVFGKNPPVTVGIPYSVYSFTLNRFLPGMFYNIIFYFFAAYLIKYLAVPKNK